MIVLNGRLQKDLRGLSCRTDSARIFPISRRKVAHRKTYRKAYRITHRKTECFHRIFPLNFSPNFRGVFFCTKNSKCHWRTASKKFSQKIHRGTEPNPECRCGRGGSLSTCPSEKQKLSRKTESFFSSQFCTSLPIAERRGRPGKGANERKSVQTQVHQKSAKRRKRQGKRAPPHKIANNKVWNDLEVWKFPKCWAGTSAERNCPEKFLSPKWETIRKSRANARREPKNFLNKSRALPYEKNVSQRMFAAKILSKLMWDCWCESAQNRCFSEQFNKLFRESLEWTLTLWAIVATYLYLDRSWERGDEPQSLWDPSGAFQPWKSDKPAKSQNRAILSRTS